MGQLTDIYFKRVQDLVTEHTYKNESAHQIDYMQDPDRKKMIQYYINKLTKRCFKEIQENQMLNLRFRDETFEIKVNGGYKDFTHVVKLYSTNNNNNLNDDELYALDQKSINKCKALCKLIMLHFRNCPLYRDKTQYKTEKHKKKYRDLKKENTKIKEKINNLEDNLNKINNEKNLLINKNNELNNLNAKQKDQINQLSNQLKNQNNENFDLNSKISDLKKTIDNEKNLLINKNNELNNLDAEQKDQINQLSNQLNCQQSEYTDLIKEKDQVILKLDNQLKNKSDENLDLNSKNLNLQNTINNNKHNYQKKISAFEKQIENLNNQIDSLNQEKENLVNQGKKTESELKKINKLIKEYKFNNKELSNDNLKYEKEIKDKNNKINITRTQNRKLKDKNEKNDKEIKNLSNEISELHSLKNKQTQTIKQKNNEIQKLENEKKKTEQIFLERYEALLNKSQNENVNNNNNIDDFSISLNFLTEFDSNTQNVIIANLLLFHEDTHISYSGNSIDISFPSQLAKAFKIHQNIHFFQDDEKSEIEKKLSSNVDDITNNLAFQLEKMASAINKSNHSQKYNTNSSKWNTAYTIGKEFINYSDPFSAAKDLIQKTQRVRELLLIQTINQCGTTPYSTLEIDEERKARYKKEFETIQKVRQIVTDQLKLK